MFGKLTSKPLPEKALPELGGRMKNRQSELLFIAAIIGFLGVVLGAFGAHALKDMLGETAQRQYDLGVHYAFIHALAILAAGLAIPVVGKPKHLNLAAWLFISGVVLFSGSLILIAISGIKIFAVTAPLGGLSLLLGWGFFAYAIRGK